MLLFVSFAGFRRAVFSSGPLFSNAFLTYAPRTSPAAIAANRFCQRPLSSPRFMTADALAGDKTDEEKAAIKAAREARKCVHTYDYYLKIQTHYVVAHKYIAFRFNACKT